MRIALILLWLAALTTAQTAPAPAAPAKPEDKAKTAVEQFKNIKVLKDVPADDWFATMAFISGSLGVGCEHCHVNPFEKDEKPAKDRAREMMRMVQAINAQNFAGQPNRVTCMTCHNGSTKPAKIPAIAQAGWVKEFAAATAPKSEAPAAPPEARQLIADYRAAIGGKNVARVRSRYYKGTATTYNKSSQGATSIEQEVYLAGDRIRVDLVTQQGPRSNIYDGRNGWLVTPKETRPMRPDEIASLKARVSEVLRVDALPEFTQAVTKGAEEIRGHQTWAVELTMADSHSETYYFDQLSGLLVARRATDSSAFGRYPEETWFEDYRDFDGVRLPMTVISAAVNSGLVRSYEEIRVNLPIDPKKFAVPAAGVGTGD